MILFSLEQKKAFKKQQMPEGLKITITTILNSPQRTLKTQCTIAPLCGTEGTSMNNSPRSGKWHFTFPHYYSVYTPNMPG